jgi:hypothetical protein
VASKFKAFLLRHADAFTINGDAVLLAASNKQA